MQELHRIGAAGAAFHGSCVGAVKAAIPNITAAAAAKKLGQGRLLKI